jgi:hypothetical protein
MWTHLWGEDDAHGVPQDLATTYDAPDGPMPYQVILIAGPSKLSRIRIDDGSGKGGTYEPATQTWLAGNGDVVTTETTGTWARGERYELLRKETARIVASEEEEAMPALLATLVPGPIIYALARYLAKNADALAAAWAVVDAELR